MEKGQPAVDENSGSTCSLEENFELRDPLLGETLGGLYEIIELVGSGGWGNVYRGRRTTIGVDVAIKIIHMHLSRNEDQRGRFEQEALILSKVDSVNVVKVLDYGTEPVPYIVMEFFDGIGLDEILQNRGRISPEETIAIICQVLEGLQAAHDNGLVHRDLKPGNILVRDSTDVSSGSGQLRVKILDFGIAQLIDDSIDTKDKVTTTGEILGSPPYMPPEQWTDEPVDPRSDIYSFGCIVYEMLTGKPAFSAKAPLEYIHQHLHKQPKWFAEVCDAKIPRSLEDVVFKCLHKSPAKRYTSTREILSDLKNIASGERLRIKLQKSRLTLLTRLAIWIPLPLLVLATIGFSAYTSRIALATNSCDFLNGKADGLMVDGKSHEALSLYQLSLDVSNLLLTSRHDWRRLHAMRSMAKIYKGFNDESSALELNERVWIYTGDLRNETLAGLFQRLQDERDFAQYDKAEATAQAACKVALGREEFGPESVTYAKCLILSGSVYDASGDYKKGLKYENEAGAILRKLVEPEDRMWLFQRIFLAQALAGSANIEGGEKELAGAWKTAEAVSPDQRYVCKLALARMYAHCNRLAEAQRFFKEAFDLQDERLQPNILESIRILCNWADVCQRAGQLQKAKDLLGKAVKSINNPLQLQTRYLISTTPDSVIALTQYGKILKLLQLKSEAQVALRRALTLRRSLKIVGRTTPSESELQALLE